MVRGSDWVCDCWLTEHKLTDSCKLLFPPHTQITNSFSFQACHLECPHNFLSYVSLKYFTTFYLAASGRLRIDKTWKAEVPVWSFNLYSRPLPSRPKNSCRTPRAHFVCLLVRLLWHFPGALNWCCYCCGPLKLLLGSNMNNYWNMNNTGERVAFPVMKLFPRWASSSQCSLQ